MAAKPARKSSAKVQFIFITILLDAIGMGLLIPVLPDVLRRFNPDPVFVAGHYSWFLGVYAIMQFFASPVLGSLSDRYGRRSILLVSLLAAALDYGFMAFAPTLLLLYIGRVISGLTGASMTVAGSYMADISTDEDRGANFGLIGAAWGSGFIVGPLIGGAVSGLGYAAPFLIAGGLNLLNFAFGLFVLPESLPPEHRRQVQLKQLNPFRSVFRVLKPSPISTLVWIFFILFVAGQVHPVNWTLYTQTKFGWSTLQVGLSLTFVGAVIALSNGLLTRWAIPRFGEDRSLHIGLWVYCIGFALFGLASQGWMMFAVMTFFAISGIAMPALQSIVARHVPGNEQGELQGSLVSLGSLAAVIAPFLFGGLFEHYSRPDAPVRFLGAAYVGAAIICLGALALDFFRAKGDEHVVHVAVTAKKPRAVKKKAVKKKRGRE